MKTKKSQDGLASGTAQVNLNVPADWVGIKKPRATSRVAKDKKPSATRKAMSGRTWVAIAASLLLVVAVCILVPWLWGHGEWNLSSLKIVESHRLEASQKKLEAAEAKLETSLAKQKLAEEGWLAAEDATTKAKTAEEVLKKRLLEANTELRETLKKQITLVQQLEAANATKVAVAPPPVQTSGTNTLQITEVELADGSLKEIGLVVDTNDPRSQKRALLFRKGGAPIINLDKFDIKYGTNIVSVWGVELPPRKS